MPRRSSEWLAGYLARGTAAQKAVDKLTTARRAAAPRESALHKLILAECGRRNLVAFHGSTAHRKIQGFVNLLLREEGPGIVNLMLRGLLVALKEIQETGNLHLSDVQQDRIDTLILRTESHELFVQQCLEEDENEDVSSEEIMTAFSEFCIARGWKMGAIRRTELRLSQSIANRFGNVGSKHVTRGESKRTLRGWRGLKLKDQGFRATEDFERRN